MKSNVTLRSNVYINKTQSTFDSDFILQLRDYAVLKQYYNPSTKICDAPLSPLQRRIVEQASPKCAYEVGTMSWGVPIGGNQLVCRCEETDCERYPECSAKPNFEKVHREYAQPDSVEFEPELTAQAPFQPTKSLTMLPGKETVFGPLPVETRQENTISEDAVLKPSEDKTFAGQTEKSEEPPPQENQPIQRTETITQDNVICAGLESRIFVNAGPGTGKTYTVVKRLCKIFEGNDFEGTVLVLCFSKNAVNVIGSRFRDAVGHRADALMEDGGLIIRTFDSFATYALADELPPGLNYEQRIEMFIEKLGKNPDILDEVAYLIVDEVQDTVGNRARMLQTMIENASFGVLLLGDSCQAIYDWNARAKGDWTSEKLFCWIAEQNFQICELETNHRQADILDQMGMQMRDSLLHGTEAEQEQTLSECKAQLRNLRPSCGIKGLPQKLTMQSDLILCKTNGEAAVISDKLFGGESGFVDHTVMQAAGHKSLAPWIGMILGGCTEELISRETFGDLAAHKGIEDIEEKWEALKSLDSHTRSAVLHRREALGRLMRLDALPDICLNLPENGVIVSTVHRAKGSEADHVYWLDSPLVLKGQEKAAGVRADALKASYVAVTRAKKDIQIIDVESEIYTQGAMDSYLKCLGGDRWIKAIPYKRKGIKRFCGGITMQPDDVDLFSCVAGSDAQQIQELLAQMAPGIDLELYPSTSGSGFDIFCDGCMIGKTNGSFTDALFAGFQATNNNKNMPVSIDSAYISALITVVEPNVAKTENVYQASGCWLGYELGGFAHINYS